MNTKRSNKKRKRTINFLIIRKGELSLFIMEDMQGITFYELWKEYNDYIILKLKPQSYRKINSNFKNHILPFFKNYKLKDINHKVYMKWQLEIEKKGFKNSYNKHLHGTMVAIFNYAIKFEYLEKNVPSKVGNFTKKRNERKNVDFWTLDEFNKFISVIDDKMYELLFKVLYYTGLRIGECLALSWEDFKYNYIDINKTISKEKDKNDNYIINSPKTETSYRQIKIDNELINLFMELYKEKSKIKAFNKKWFIFGGSKPFTHSTVTRRKNIYCEKANVKKIRLHDLRHSHATLLLSNNVPITVISQRLGHADTNMTLNTYSHLITKDIDRAVELINNIKSTTI